ncbi:MAG: rhodanese-like domain-containing protein [Candidatus Cloacimonetes bacterium]|nr:rhodanese-like domain-containing protein [Candidatus Cloacimonadota bacterium]
MAFLLLLSGCGNGFSEGGYFADGKALAAEVKSGITEITRDEFLSRLENGKLRVLIDVREPSEFEEGYINQANEDFEFPYPETFTVNIPRGILEFKIGEKSYWDEELWLEMPPIDEEIVVYSKTGKRSALAAQALLELGYNKVTSLKGGYRKWLDPNAPEEEAVKSSGGCG